MKSKPATNSKTAMSQYYDDMLGSISGNSLKSLEATELKENSDPIKSKNLSQKLNVKPKVKPKPQNRVNKSLLGGSQVPENLVQKNELSEKIISRPYAEPQLEPIKKFVIPETLPKLAPVVISAELKVKPSVAIDSKTALALLEAKKSKMTLKQRQLFEQKLRSKHNLTANNKMVIVGDELAQSSPELKFSEEVIPSQKTGRNNGLPTWANERFECLLFSVAGLKLAVPLMSLGAIYKIEGELSPLVGRAEWFMGLYRHSDRKRNVQVVDSARWIMPDRCSEETRKQYNFIIRLGDSDWGLACDAVHRAIQLEPSQVKWRTDRSKRAWLSGTVISQMCALLDVDALSNILTDEAGC